MSHQYPIGIDCVWIASDLHGNLAAFVTGGEGPIPFGILDNGMIPIEDIEMAICDLDVVADARLLVPMPRPDDFIDIAKRGIYVFDWQDVSRIAQERTGVYEKIAVPTNPITLENLPVKLRSLGERITCTSLLFSDASKVNVQGLFECKSVG